MENKDLILKKVFLYSFAEFGLYTVFQICTLGQVKSQPDWAPILHKDRTLRGSN